MNQSYHFEVKHDSTPERECDAKIELTMDRRTARQLVDKLDRALTEEGSEKVSVTANGYLLWDEEPER